MAASLCAAGCGSGVGSPISPSSETLSLEDVTSSAAVGDVMGTRQAGAAPASGSGPVITATGNETVVNGGTMVVTITAATPFQTVYVRVGAQAAGITAAGTGRFEGFYELRLPRSEISVPVLLTFPQTIRLERFDLEFAAADPLGVVGPYTALATRTATVGTGDVQVTLSWDADSDVDLHVVAPGDEEVFYGLRQVPSGGQLDLDSNAGCQLDHVRNENITWPLGRAPRGQYIVRVDYWASCGVERTNFTVRINNGGTTQIFRGTFTGPGDQGGRGAGRTIATFQR